MESNQNVNNNFPPAQNRTSKNSEKCSPFLRLYETPTKSFIERLKGSKSDSKDFLDFSLNSVYDHHFQWWASKHVTTLQDKTYPDKMKIKEKSQVQSSFGIKNNNDASSGSNKKLRPAITEYRNDANHTNIGVQCPHLANSRRGFGRSIDGVFYNL